MKNKKERPILQLTDKGINILEEAKEDQQRLIHFAGNSLAKRFFDLKNKNGLKSPENDIYYWLKKTPLELETRVTEIEMHLVFMEKAQNGVLQGEIQPILIATKNTVLFYIILFLIIKSMLLHYTLKL